MRDWPAPRHVGWPYTLGMSLTFDLPDSLAARLEAEAARRGTSVEELAVAALAERYGRGHEERTSEDALEAFLGSVDSGDPDWARTDTHQLRAEADRRSRSA